MNCPFTGSNMVVTIISVGICVVLIVVGIFAFVCVCFLGLILYVCFDCHLWLLYFTVLVSFIAAYIFCAATFYAHVLYFYVLYCWCFYDFLYFCLCIATLFLSCWFLFYISCLGQPQYWWKCWVKIYSVNKYKKLWGRAIMIRAAMPRNVNCNPLQTIFSTKITPLKQLFAPRQLFVADILAANSSWGLQFSAKGGSALLSLYSPNLNWGPLKQFYLKRRHFWFKLTS